MSQLNRTYSSPSLRAANILDTRNGASASNRQKWESQKNTFDYHFIHEPNEQDYDEEFYVIGDRVFVDNSKPASVAYFGEVEFASGDWVGVVMDNPLGNHNGKVHGREYFQCAPFHGLFVRPHRISRMADSALGHSRSSTPLPTIHQSHRRPLHGYGGGGIASPAASSVTTDSSYFYDDDYRQPKLPTTTSIAALGQRIDEIEANSRPQSRGSGSSMGGRTTCTPPVGILKKSTKSYGRGSHNQQQPRSRSETRQTNYQPDDPKVPVFNFRPRRAKYESPGILSDASNRADANSEHPVMVDLSSEPAQLGDRVWVSSERGDMAGVLRFMGETNFATGEWAGIELDQADGKNDGSVLGFRYFHCPDKYGLFVPATRVRKQVAGAPGFKAMRSTIKSPPPAPKATIAAGSGGYDSSSTRSMTPSSYYSSSAPSKTTTPSPANEHLGPNQYSSSSQNITPPPEDPMSLLEQYLARRGDKLERPKFDDNDIEYQLRRSLNRNVDTSRQSAAGTMARDYLNASDLSPSKLVARPRCVKYTFSSSKYDGNPVARRTVEYG